MSRFLRSRVAFPLGVWALCHSFRLPFSRGAGRPLCDVPVVGRPLLHVAFWLTRD